MKCLLVLVFAGCIMQSFSWTTIPYLKAKMKTLQYTFDSVAKRTQSVLDSRINYVAQHLTNRIKNLQDRINNGPSQCTKWWYGLGSAQNDVSDFTGYKPCAMGDEMSDLAKFQYTIYNLNDQIDQLESDCQSYDVSCDSRATVLESRINSERTDIAHRYNQVKEKGDRCIEVRKDLIENQIEDVYKWWKKCTI